MSFKKNKKNKKKRITKNIQMALADPSDAAMMASTYAGLGSVGSINEEINKIKKEINDEVDKIITEISENISFDSNNEALDYIIQKINRRKS